MRKRLIFPRSPELLALLQTENFRHKRTSYTVAAQGREIRVTITAEDTTALRTAEGSVDRVARLLEKARTFG